MSSLKQQGIKAFIWDFSGKMATQGMGFIVTIFLARLLEPSEFGLIAMIMVIIGIASVFTDVGLGSALIQRRKVLPIHYSSVFYFNVFVGFLLTCITYFSAGWVAEFYQNDTLIPLTQVMSLSFVINSFSSVHTTKLRKELNYSVITKASFIASLISGFVGITLALYGAGVWSLVSQALTMGIVYNLLVWVLCNWKPSFLFSLKALMHLWRFGFHLFFAEFLNAIFIKLDFLIIGKLFMPATLGFFQRAKSLNSMVVHYSSGSLMSVLFPVLSKLKSDHCQFKKVVVKMMGIICFITFLLLGGLFVISEELIIFLFGIKWLPSANFFQILVFSGFGYPVSALLVNVLASRGNSKAILKIQIYKNTITGINLYVGFLWGINGYLYGLIITTSINVMINIYMASHEINLSVFRFVELIIDQSVITAVAITWTLYLTVSVDTEVQELLLIIKSLLFLFTYFLVNRGFNTYSYQSFSELVSPLLKKKYD